MSKTENGTDEAHVDFIVEDEEVRRDLVRGQLISEEGRHRRQSPRRRDISSVQRDFHRFHSDPSREPEGGTILQEVEEEEEEDEENVTENRRLAVTHFTARHLHHRDHPQHLHRFQSTTPNSVTDREESSSGTNMSMSLSDRHPNHNQSTVSLLDSMERRTQRTYRYGIGLVCVGATLNWLGFAQGHGYVDPLRYLGVACVISGSFCVCLAMCRWLGRPISVSTHRVSGLTRLEYQDERTGRQNGDVHVINVSVPMYAPPMHEEYRPTKPPDYEVAVAGEPPPYDEAIKLSPGALFTTTSTTTSSTTKNVGGSTVGVQTSSDNFFACGHPSPSHSTNLIASHHHPHHAVVERPNLTATTTLTLTTNNLNPNTQGFLPDSVVAVDASESANNWSSHMTKLGAPPPYTKEYTPSPRHSISFGCQDNCANSSSSSSSNGEPESDMNHNLSTNHNHLQAGESLSLPCSGSASGSSSSSSSSNSNVNNINHNNSNYTIVPVHSARPSSSSNLSTALSMSNNNNTDQNDNPIHVSLSISSYETSGNGTGSSSGAVESSIDRPSNLNSAMNHNVSEA